MQSSLLLALALAPLAGAQTAGRLILLADIESLDRSADGALWGVSRDQVVRSTDAAIWKNVVHARRASAMLVSADGARVVVWSGDGLERCELEEGRADGEPHLERVLEAREPERRLAGLAHGGGTWLAWEGGSTQPFMVRECLAGEGVHSTLLLSRDEGASWSAPALLEGGAVVAAGAAGDGRWMLLLAGGGVARLDAGEADEAPRLALLVPPDCAAGQGKVDHGGWIAFEDHERGRLGGRTWQGLRIERCTQDGGATWQACEPGLIRVVGAHRLPSGVFVELLQGRAPAPYRVRTRRDAPWEELRAFARDFSFTRIDAAGGLLLGDAGGEWLRLAPDGARWSELAPPEGGR